MRCRWDLLVYLSDIANRPPWNLPLLPPNLTTEEHSFSLTSSSTGLYKARLSGANSLPFHHILTLIFSEHLYHLPRFI
ncbi:hypothetical protein HBI56_148700 [Parastagonospora nodorum]|nr:hypothetical protein HBH53_051990 [Parastagonospora nodorum]KAH3995570.1 hypothetical protein HBI10_169530 [Parastagonospora nodorum]KAH4015824.1 hypothetical protein HBI13_159120 [Parastagonospora nodorum]KAH4045840.1 hypothetical protein HBH49_196240 [Parastagonospora nodorum]KAH4124924.1 hypothetical protein HBH47_062150 [Parastagonospora nodorum]